MFGWLKSIAYKPVAPQADPGWASRIALSQTGAEERAQELDLVALLATVLRKHGYRPQRRAEWLAMPGGLLLQPRFLSLDTRADGSVHTVTTVSVCHREVLPKGLFELHDTQMLRSKKSIRFALAVCLPTAWLPSKAGYKKVALVAYGCLHHVMVKERRKPTAG